MKQTRRAWLLSAAAATGCVTLPGISEVPGRWLGYAGRQWRVRDDPFPADPGLNRWAVGRRAILRQERHLELSSRTDTDGPWGVELWTPISSPVRVEFKVTPQGEGLHPDDVVGLFLYRDGRCEVDIELTRWGVAQGPDTFHTFADRRVRSERLDASTLPTRHSIDLAPTHVQLESHSRQGSVVSKAPLCACEAQDHILRVNVWRRDSQPRPPTRVHVEVAFVPPS